MISSARMIAVGRFAMKTCVAGYPRIGHRRELKKAEESFFRGEIGERELLETARSIRCENWKRLRESDIDSIPSNDFSLYDNVLDAACLIGAIPERYANAGLSPLRAYFAMARGDAEADLKALPMRKWFTTNYHYIVPELTESSRLRLSGDKPFDEYREALELGIRTRPFIVGPFTFLKLASYAGNLTARDFVGQISAAYRSILDRCASEGIDAIDLGESALVTDLSHEDVTLFSKIYREILSAKGRVSVRLHTSFGDIRDCWTEVMALPFDSVALDFVEGPGNLDLLARHGFPSNRELVAGVISGRNVWKTDVASAACLVSRISALSGCDPSSGRLSLGASCSLLHVPLSLTHEASLNPGVRSRLSFAEEKLSELTSIAAADDRARVNADTTADRYAIPYPAEWTRVPSRAERKRSQRPIFAFPALPTTTIGSFPQTHETRETRAALRRGEISATEYDAAIRRMIADCVSLQEEIGLDVLVHGEYERNDMVEFFGQNLEGFAFTANGWVQSYGTRCVKPPIIVSDVRRARPLTVDLAVYAQSLSPKPVKGMLTGPVTILNWSFPREDIPLAESCFQIARAIREEALDLERNGIKIIQIDEAALKEKLPLRESDRGPRYLDWAIPAFRLCASGLRPETQVHTHMCYSEFADIVSAIDALDADVITFEAARSNLSLLDALADAGFETDVGPGVYDIHSPRVPSVDEIASAIRVMLEKLGRNATAYDGLWVNPDCGLKTRGVEETVASLRNLVAAAKSVREGSGT